MNGKFLGLFAALIVSTIAITSANAQQHRATRLGNPATRFSNPLKTPDDLRALFRSGSLRADVEFIARESGFKGDMEDLRQAAATARILPLRIPVGTILPAMSSRKNGRPVLLREVLWEGKQAIDAYEFQFNSQGRRYRIVCPKACANFWVEDHGRQPKPALALECEAPEQLQLRRAVQVCVTVRNTGDDVEPLAVVSLKTPAGASLTSATIGGKLTGDGVSWETPGLGVGGSRKLCAVFSAPETGTLAFDSTARGNVSPQVESRCATRVVGVPGVLLEVIDLEDPVEVGSNEVYQITVSNQGTATITNVKVICALEESQSFVSGSGTSAVTAEDRKILMEALPALRSKEKASWQVVVKALATGDVRFATELTSDEFKNPITETEATQQY